MRSFAPALVCRSAWRKDVPSSTNAMASTA